MTAPLPRKGGFVVFVWVEVGGVVDGSVWGAEILRGRERTGHYEDGEGNRKEEEEKAHGGDLSVFMNRRQSLSLVESKIKREEM